MQVTVEIATPRKKTWAVREQFQRDLAGIAKLPVAVHDSGSIAPLQFLRPLKELECNLVLS